MGQFGYYFDEETGSNYVRARVYSPTIGRWWSADPLGFIDGLNMYLYAGNQILLGIDPSGTALIPPPLPYFGGGTPGFIKVDYKNPPKSFLPPSTRVFGFSSQPTPSFVYIQDRLTGGDLMGILTDSWIDTGTYSQPHNSGSGSFDYTGRLVKSFVKVCGVPTSAGSCNTVPSKTGDGGAVTIYMDNFAIGTYRVTIRFISTMKAKGTDSKGHPIGGAISIVYGKRRISERIESPNTLVAGATLRRDVKVTSLVGRTEIAELMQEHVQLKKFHGEL